MWLTFSLILFEIEYEIALPRDYEQTLYDVKKRDEKTR
jgi:hypothetical protein